MIGFICDKCGKVVKGEWIWRDSVLPHIPDGWNNLNSSPNLRPEYYKHICDYCLNNKKIYVASSWRNKYQENVIIELRKNGYEVYDFKNPEPGNIGFKWSEIDPNWQYWTEKDYIEKLNHPIAEKGFKLDFKAMKWANCCILLLPSGRSAHTEAGWMKGAGKKVFVLLSTKIEPELMYKIYDDIFCTLNEILEILKNET